MPNSYFRFKQFTVQHGLCAMKVGTDGVSLGAWTDCFNAKNILDVGTGSGLIALMLAQRCNAQIEAIDMDENAYKQAIINFEDSPFRWRLKAFHSDFLSFSPSQTYDLIVSNPPYFSDSLKSPNPARNFARHTDELHLEDLVQKSKQLLSPTGRLSLILPFTSFDVIQEMAGQKNIYLSRKTIVRPLKHHLPKRVLLEFSMKKKEIELNDIFIEESRHIYSQEYIELTKDFYLDKTINSTRHTANNSFHFQLKQ
jgi:tRNA1Val (adenine37-N6)-methyltransferase